MHRAKAVTPLNKMSSRAAVDIVLFRWDALHAENFECPEP
jgi:hypothetical protein